MDPTFQSWYAFLFTLNINTKASVSMQYILKVVLEGYHNQIAMILILIPIPGKNPDSMDPGSDSDSSLFWYSWFRFQQKNGLIPEIPKSSITAPDWPHGHLPEAVHVRISVHVYSHTQVDTFELSSSRETNDKTTATSLDWNLEIMIDHDPCRQAVPTSTTLPTPFGVFLWLLMIIGDLSW